MTQTNRLWAIGAVTVMIALVLAGWFLGAQPFVAAAAAADAERASIEAQNATSQVAIAQLTADNERLPELEKDYAVLEESIPSTSDTSPFITGLDALAQSAGVQIAGLTVGDPRAYTVPLSASAPVADPSDTTTETTTESTDAPTTAAPTTPSAPTAVTSPLITPDNFVGIEVSIDVRGSYDAVLDFIRGLQTGDRLFLVTGITSAKDADSGSANTVSAKVTGLIYVIKHAG